MDNMDTLIVNVEIPSGLTPQIEDGNDPVELNVEQAGPRGARGPQGDPGPQGPQGESAPVYDIVKTYPSYAAMNDDYSGTDVQIGEYVIISSNVHDEHNCEIYIKGESAYEFVIDISGDPGTSGFEAYTESDTLYLLANGSESRPVYCNTTAGWNAQTTLVSEEGAIYIYSDYDEIEGTPLAGFKVGDGLAYVVDLPFIDAKVQSHMADDDIHITPAERTFWNNKNRGIVDGENLILTIN